MGTETSSVYPFQSLSIWMSNLTPDPCPASRDIGPFLFNVCRTGNIEMNPRGLSHKLAQKDPTDDGACSPGSHIPEICGIAL